MTWSAPGKLLLFGEYAVLRGAPALVTAVDRRVVVRPASSYSVVGLDADDRLPNAVRDVLGADALDFEVDVTAMFAGDIKLGLGSSAASTVALVAAALDDATPDEVFRSAFAAHRAFQNGAGSGSDVAAATYGGTLAMTPGDDLPEVEQLPWPEDLTVFAVWTGRDADTRRFIDAVDATNRPLTSMQQLAEAAVTAFKAGDTERLLVIANDYDDAMGKLGAAAGVPIRTRRHARIARIVRDFGATAKPSGAGGGDVSLVLSRNDLTRDTLINALPKDARLLNLAFGAPGVRRDLEDQS